MRSVTAPTPLPSWWRARFDAAARSSAKPDLPIDLDEARSVAFCPHVPPCLFTAFGIVVDSTGDEPAHFFIGKKSGHGRHLCSRQISRGFDELNEIPIGNIHGVLRLRVPEANLLMQTIAEK
jgi:hypothetical protein